MLIPDAPDCLLTAGQSYDVYFRIITQVVGTHANPVMSAQLGVAGYASGWTEIPAPRLTGALDRD